MDDGLPEIDWSLVPDLQPSSRPSPVLASAAPPPEAAPPKRQLPTFIAAVRTAAGGGFDSAPVARQRAAANETALQFAGGSNLSFNRSRPPAGAVSTSNSAGSADAKTAAALSASRLASMARPVIPATHSYANGGGWSGAVHARAGNYKSKPAAAAAATATAATAPVVASHSYSLARVASIGTGSRAEPLAVDDFDFDIIHARYRNGAAESSGITGAVRLKPTAGAAAAAASASSSAAAAASRYGFGNGGGGGGGGGNESIYAARTTTQLSKRNGANAKKVMLQLVSEESVGVQFPDAVKRNVMPILESVLGARFDSELGMWTIPLSAHASVLRQLKELESVGFDRSDIKVSPIDTSVLEYLRKHKEPPSRAKFDDLGLPPAMSSTMYEFQKRGVEYVIDRAGRAQIADDMGLGKTIQAIAISFVYKADWPVLVICPSSVRLNWRAEFLKWLPELKKSNVHVLLNSGTKKKPAVLLPSKAHTRVVIISYDLASKFEAPLAKANFQVIICDESHYIKSADAKRTQCILPLLTAAKRAILLTGTPALSRPMELYTQINALRPNLFGSTQHFGLRYCEGKKGRFGWEYKGAANLVELHLLLKKFCMIRRMKSEVLTMLKPKTRTGIFCEITDKEIAKLFKVQFGESAGAGAGAAALAAAIDSAGADESIQPEHSSAATGSSAAAGGGGSGLAAKDRQAKLFELYLKTGEAKLKASCQAVTDLIAGGAKFLLFAHHTSVLDGLEKHLKSLEVGYFRIDGSTPVASRQSGVDSFQIDPAMRVALLSITAGGTGITLTAASTVVFAELYWTPALLMQAEDRVHRIGQRNAVNIQYIIGNGTLDDKMWPMIQNKLEVLGNTLNGQEEAMEFKGFAGSGAVKADLEKKAKRKKEIVSAAATAAASGTGTGGATAAAPPDVLRLASTACAPPAAAAAADGDDDDDDDDDDVVEIDSLPSSAAPGSSSSSSAAAAAAADTDSAFTPTLKGLTTRNSQLLDMRRRAAALGFIGSAIQRAIDFLFADIHAKTGNDNPTISFEQLIDQLHADAKQAEAGANADPEASTVKPGDGSAGSSGGPKSKSKRKGWGGGSGAAHGSKRIRASEAKTQFLSHSSEGAPCEHCGMSVALDALEEHELACARRYAAANGGVATDYRIGTSAAAGISVSSGSDFSAELVRRASDAGGPSVPAAGWDAKDRRESQVISDDDDIYTAPPAAAGSSAAAAGDADADGDADDPLEDLADAAEQRRIVRDAVRDVVVVDDNDDDDADVAGAVAGGERPPSVDARSVGAAAADSAAGDELPPTQSDGEADGGPNGGGDQSMESAPPPLEAAD